MGYLEKSGLQANEQALFDYLRRPALVNADIRSMFSSDKKRHLTPVCKYAPSDEPYIPLISHHVWLSDPNEPHVLTSNDRLFYHTFKHISVLNEDKEDWVHYFWTVSEELV